MPFWFDTRTQQSLVELRFHTPSVPGKRQQLACCHCVTMVCVSSLRLRRGHRSGKQNVQNYNNKILKLTINIINSNLCHSFSVVIWNQCKDLVGFSIFLQQDGREPGRGGWKRTITQSYRVAAEEADKGQSRGPQICYWPWGGPLTVFVPSALINYCPESGLPGCLNQMVNSRLFPQPLD